MIPLDLDFDGVSVMAFGHCISREKDHGMVGFGVESHGGEDLIFPMTHSERLPAMLHAP